MSVTVPTWIVVLLIFVAFIALCWWIDRRVLRPLADRLVEKLVSRRERRRANQARSTR